MNFLQIQNAILQNILQLRTCTTAILNLANEKIIPNVVRVVYLNGS